jgi:protease-4
VAGRFALLAAVVLIAAGCRPLHVAADAKVSLPQPLSVAGDVNVSGQAKVIGDAKVSTTIPPVFDQSPIRPTVVMCEPAGEHLPRVAILDVDGLLLNTDMVGVGSHGENPVSMFREKLDAVAADPLVVAVVLRINSPGGGVTATDIMWHDLRAFKNQTHLPVLACLLDAGAGGAYYLATAADQVIVHPTSIVGGIGVILNLYNLQDTMAQFNISAESIKAGKRIDLGSPVAALDEEGRKLLQAMADSFQQRFRHIVLEARKKVDAQDATNFDGRVFTAQDALQRGFVDHIGYLNDAIDEAAQIAGQQKVNVAFYHRPSDRAQSLYAATPNVPLQGGLLPLSLPGLDRSRMPTFLYLWQLDPTMEKLGGK